ncbi:sigma-G-dependent sporulation-specific acid-soluble spore protein CsgA [Evansella cellulosilytica]|uniref:Sporulation protein n=1 Tax=Evansella cellulosilytica (strain ATCC 21833 / DSM 2522 / FERM P-1141 / JCM 9156 / N-4) TaxID=649639 RepID=E6TRA0_EVAC2|nr:sigma-G-dependent sporulation-specific acid-soluble spore protein CsgA [Evansella cellulosilytica]ADU30612.1 hypothetical protein Bcell_2353 [Evansella cellulosilytica DSM 2522]
MDVSLRYLLESLSNYIDDDEEANEVYVKLKRNSFKNEKDFSKSLSTREIEKMNQIIKNEIHYANEENDEKRSKELNEVYENLF